MLAFNSKLTSEEVRELKVVEPEMIGDEEHRHYRSNGISMPADAKQSTVNEEQFPTEKLSINGFNADDMKKFRDAGIFPCNGFMLPTKKTLPGIKEFSESQVAKILEGAENILRKTFFGITNGSSAADELFAGGIDTMAINNAFGKFRCGNTKLCQPLCITTQLPTSMKGGNGKVAYIDTEGTFRTDRIVPIAERFGMDPGAVLDNTTYARAYTYEHQYNLLLGLAAKMSEEPIQLLIVDSTTVLFRVEFTGRGELADRQQKLVQMLALLINIAEEFNVAVYMTNQVTSNRMDVKKLQDAEVFTYNGFMLPTKKRKTIFQITSGSEAPDELLAVTNHGIDAGDVKKLQDAGIFTCNGLMMHTKKNFGYIIGSDALLKRKTVVLITTGSQALDELLAGGIETMAITEAFGEFRCGKTPLAHTLCVTTQLPITMKGVSVKVAYIETTGNFKGFAGQHRYDPERRRKLINYPKQRCCPLRVAVNSAFKGDINTVYDYESHFNPGIIREEPTRVVWYKEPLEVKSREDMVRFATNLSFDRLYQILGGFVHREEDPGTVEYYLEKDGAEALASFVKYYLEDRPVNLQELTDDLVQIFYDTEDGGLPQFLRPEEIGDENISYLMNSVTTFYARPPSDRWYSQTWEL